jgi:hypothetical protein
MNRSTGRTTTLVQDLVEAAGEALATAEGRMPPARVVTLRKT